MKLVLLPGMDGTGLLFEPLLKALPSHLEPLVVRYPTDQVLNEQALLQLIEGALPNEPHVLLGESFSGPLSIRIAARATTHWRALILVATFIRSPVNALFSSLGPLASVASVLPVPRLWVQRQLLGSDAPSALVDCLLRANAAVAPRVVASRLRAVLKVDVTADAKRLNLPVLYLGAKHDRVVSTRSAREVREAYPPLETIMLDAPHLLLQRRPDEAAAVIDAFITRNTQAW